MRHRVNEEGLIEIFWEVDGALRAGFDHYQIEFSTIDENAHSTYITQRSDFDKCFYTDKRYAGEKGEYKVYIYFKSEADRPRSLGSLDLEQAEPEVQVEYMKEDRIRLSWTYPYRSAVDVVYGGESVAEKVTDGIAEFSLAGQEERVVELRFSPVDDWVIRMRIIRLTSKTVRIYEKGIIIYSHSVLFRPFRAGSVVDNRI